MKDIKHVRTALSVIRESEEIILRLKVSVSSASRKVMTGANGYLKQTKRSILVELVIASAGGSLRNILEKLSKAIMKVLHMLWLRITNSP